MTNELCSINNQGGLIVLVNIYTGEMNSTLTNVQLAKLEMEAGEDEENNTCLLDHLRPELSGFRAAANVIVPCQKCSVDNTRGYIVIEYSCLIATNSKLEIPACSGAVNGTRIRIQNSGFPNTGLNNSENHCQCTIRSEATVLIITTYYMKLSDKQTVTIADAHGVGITYTNTSLDRDRNTDLLPINDTLSLTWTNNETVLNNADKFWMELYANHTQISITCEELWRPTTTTETVSTPDMVKSTNSTTVETTKLSQQSSSSTKYTAKTQLHKVTRTATTTTPPTTTMSTTLNVDTSATEGNIEASKNVEGDETKFPLFQVIAIIVGVILIVALSITAVLIYKKKQRSKLKDKRREDDSDDDGNTADSARNKLPCEDEVGPDGPQTRTKKVLPLLEVSSKIQPAGNTSFDLHRPPPIYTDVQKHVSVAVVSGCSVKEGPDDMLEKRKKRRKKKRRTKTTIYPEQDDKHNDEPDDWHNTETMFTETNTNQE